MYWYLKLDIFVGFLFSELLFLQIYLIYVNISKISYRVYRWIKCPPHFLWEKIENTGNYIAKF